MIKYLFYFLKEHELEEAARIKLAKEKCQATKQIFEQNYYEFKKKERSSQADEHAVFSQNAYQEAQLKAKKIKMEKEARFRKISSRSKKLPASREPEESSTRNQVTPETPFDP